MAGENVTVKAFAETIQVFKDAHLVATHNRCYGKRAEMLAAGTLSAITRKEAAQYSASQASGTGTESGSPARIKKHKLLRKRAHGNPKALYRRRGKGLLAQESGIP